MQSKIEKLISEYENKAAITISQITEINRELRRLRNEMTNCLAHEWISATQHLAEDRNILRAKYSAYIQFKHDLKGL